MAIPDNFDGDNGWGNGGRVVGFLEWIKRRMELMNLHKRKEVIGVCKEKTASDQQITDICQIKQLITEKNVIDKKLGKLITPLTEYMGESNLLVANDGAKIATFNINKNGSRVFRIVRRIGGQL